MLPTRCENKAIGFLLTGLFALLAVSEIAAEDERPSIVFAIADDWGWPHARTYENDSVVQTPTFDRIANEGILFTNALSSNFTRWERILHKS